MNHAQEIDPVIGEFHNFLASDIAARPDAMRAIDSALRVRRDSLLGAVEVDLNAPRPNVVSDD